MQVSRGHLPALEGVRALAFLLVFSVHFGANAWTLVGHAWWQVPWILAAQVSVVAVPIFFALSGYLITGVLYDTRRRAGFFRVFYLRRAIRILPLYYLVLLGVFVVSACLGTHLSSRHLLLLLHLHNWWPAGGYYDLNKYVEIGHFWSLGVEEQFYLLWPIVVWFLPDRRDLIAFCYTTIVLVFVVRFGWPLLHLPDGIVAYQNTLFRCDGIMMGAALALHQRKPGADLRKLSRLAAAALLAGVSVIVLRALCVGQALPLDTFGITIIQPTLSIMGVATVVLALHPGNPVHRASEWKWAVHLGRMSYGLYVIHQLFVPLFRLRVFPFLDDAIGRGVGHLVGMVLAFGLTYLLSAFLYQYVEVPAMKLKNRIPYGIGGSPAVPVPALELRWLERPHPTTQEG